MISWFDYLFLWNTAVFAGHCELRKKYTWSAFSVQFFTWRLFCYFEEISVCWGTMYSLYSKLRYFWQNCVILDKIPFFIFSNFVPLYTSTLVKIKFKYIVTWNVLILSEIFIFSGIFGFWEICYFRQNFIFAKYSWLYISIFVLIFTKYEIKIATIKIRDLSSKILFIRYKIREIPNNFHQFFFYLITEFA